MLLISYMFVYLKDDSPKEYQAAFKAIMNFIVLLEQNDSLIDIRSPFPRLKDTTKRGRCATRHLCMQILDSPDLNWYLWNKSFRSLDMSAEKSLIQEYYKQYGFRVKDGVLCYPENFLNKVIKDSLENVFFGHIFCEGKYSDMSKFLIYSKHEKKEMTDEAVKTKKTLIMNTLIDLLNQEDFSKKEILEIFSEVVPRDTSPLP